MGDVEKYVFLVVVGFGVVFVMVVVALICGCSENEQSCIAKGFRWDCSSDRPLFGCASSIANDTCWCNPQKEQAEYESVEIYSLNMQDELSGLFFLGIGGFDTDLKYYFYKKEGDGIILDSVYAESTVLVESNETPHIRYYHILSALHPVKKKNELHIPYGTVKFKFNVETNKI